MARAAWQGRPRVGLKWIALSTLIVSAVLLTIYNRKLGVREYLEAKIARPIEFRVRDHLGKTPPLDPRIKIYSIDDKTFERMESWVLDIYDWAQILSLIAEAKPKAILIDAAFGKVPSGSGKAAEALEILRKIEVPIVTGAFINASPIRYREALPVRSSAFDLSALASSPKDLPPMLDWKGYSVYGAMESLRSILKVGHMMHLPNSKAAPLILVDRGDDVNGDGDGDQAFAVPHMSLSAVGSIAVEGGRLFVNDVVVPVDSGGLVEIDYNPPKDYQEVNNSLSPVIARARSGKKLDRIKPGDYVLILPQMYTGNVDFKFTPYGEIPGGLIQAALLNSAVSGRWLKPLAAGEVLLVIAVLLGAGLAIALSPKLFFPGIFLTELLIIGASLYLFAWHSIVVPWLFPCAGLLLNGFSLFAAKVWHLEKRAQTLRSALEGSVSDAELKEILKRPDAINFEARERVVTLVFIDVVGFSLLAENMLPRMAFDNLKKMLSTIGDTIHKYGGIVDKTLGDGLLAYFGYHLTDDLTSPDHAEKALRCCIEIQTENLMRNLEAARLGEPVYPLRIGINTASCYLGDLGSSNRIDFTVVGNGVNFAKRLEGACEMHSVLIGSTTYDLVRGIGLPSDAFTKRFVRIKHHSELVEAFEYDPFYDKPEQRAAALEAFRKCANIERIDQRWPVKDPTKIQVITDFGEAQLINFSHTGFSLKLGRLLTKGTTLNLSLDAAGGALRSLLKNHDIGVLHGEVRWGYDDGEGYVHGVMLQNLSDEQSDYLVQYLCEFAFSRDSRRRSDEPSGKAS